MGKLRVACILEQATYKPGDQAPEGYLAWHEWAEVQHKAGLRQTQCGKCGLWRYPQELSGEMIQWQGFTARGRRVDQIAPLCLRCKTPPRCRPAPREGAADGRDSVGPTRKERQVQFEDWVKENSDEYGLDVSLPQEQAIRFARAVWDAAFEAGMNEGTEAAKLRAGQQIESEAPAQELQQPAQTGIPSGWRFVRNADGSIGIWAPAQKPGESPRTSDCIYPDRDRDLHELLGKLADHQARVG